MKIKAAHILLEEAFKRKKKLVPGFSKSMLARDLGVSAAFISNIFNGKKLPPKDRLDRLIYLLEIDTHSKNQLIKSILIENQKNQSIKEFVQEVPKAELKRNSIAHRYGDNFLSQWWFIAVLESLSLIKKNDPIDEMKKRLGLSDAQWNDAIKILKMEGLIEETEDGLKKVEAHLYLPTARTKKTIRNFHSQMIQKSLDELQKTDEMDFQRRLITGFTFALSREQLDGLKQKVITFLDEATQEAGKGECQDVYQFNLQLFPLTKE